MTNLLVILKKPVTWLLIATITCGFFGVGALMSIGLATVALLLETLPFLRTAIKQRNEATSLTTAAVTATGLNVLVASIAYGFGSAVGYTLS